MEVLNNSMNKKVTETMQKRPLLISGPCSAETEEQVIKIATDLAATGKVDMLRAGIWKPRTKPGMFEGVGAKALPWLQQAKKLTGLPVSVEVATAKHVEMALHFEIDVLWIGARTTVNPFSVQEVADALKGVSIPVLVKNPIHPDVELWSGALERLQKVGLTNLGMIHRGFSSYGNKKYRNAPMWQLPIEMKRRFENMLMICDPSHICGNRNLLKEVAQKSIDLDFDGLMLETHPNPDMAWSDALQQLTAANYHTLINELVWRSESIAAQEFISALATLREQINQIDDELLLLLSERMKLADAIGTYKKENNITILQTTRWKEILDNAMTKATALGLSENFITRFLDAIHLESIHHQNTIMNSSTSETKQV